MNDSATRIEPIDLAALLGSRLCHDLVSPLGAISNGVELLQMSGMTQGPEMQLVADAVAAARVRLQTFRMAFGQPGSDQRVSAPELRKLLDGMAELGRMKIELDAPGDQPRDDVRMLLLAIMCLESAMPWGGRIMVVRTGPSWRLLGEAERVKPEPSLWAWLDGAGPGGDADAPPPPARVHFALLAEAARAAGRRIRWELDDSGAEIAF